MKKRILTFIGLLIALFGFIPKTFAIVKVFFPPMEDCPPEYLIGQTYSYYAYISGVDSAPSTSDFYFNSTPNKFVTASFTNIVNEGDKYRINFNITPVTYNRNVNIHIQHIPTGNGAGMDINVVQKPTKTVQLYSSSDFNPDSFVDEEIVLSEGKVLRFYAFAGWICRQIDDTDTNITSTATWTSSDNSIFTVNNGVVTGKSAGTAVLTVSKTSGGQTYTRQYLITVGINGKIDIEGNTTLKAGETETLTGKVYKATAGIINPDAETTEEDFTFDEEASNNITWKSSDTKILTVDGGKITGISAGTAIVTARYEYPTGEFIEESIEITITGSKKSVTPSKKKSKKTSQKPKTNPPTGVFVSVAGVSVLIIGGISILLINRKKKIIKI